MVGSVGSGGGNIWAQIKQRQEAKAPQNTTPTQATAHVNPAAKTSPAAFKERAEAAKAKSQKLKTDFASITDKMSQKKQIRQRLDALGADKVKINSQGFGGRLGQAFIKLGKMTLGGMAKGLLNIPKFFNFLGKDTRLDSDVFEGNFKKDFEKYQKRQEKVDQWMVSGRDLTDADSVTGDYTDLVSPVGDYLGFNAPSDLAGNSKGVTAGDAKGASEAGATIGIAGGLKTALGALDGIDGAIGSYQAREKFGQIKGEAKNKLSDALGHQRILNAPPEHSKEKQDLDAIQNKTQPRYNEIKQELKAHSHSSMLHVPVDQSGLDVELLPKDQSDEQMLSEHVHSLQTAYTAKKAAYLNTFVALGLDPKKTTDSAEKDKGIVLLKTEIDKQIQIIETTQRAENREDRKLTFGSAAAAFDGVQSVNGIMNAGAAIAGSTAQGLGVATQAFGGVFGAGVSLFAAVKDISAARASSKRETRADLHLSSVKGNPRSASQEKMDQAVKLMRKNQAQSKYTKFFSSAKNFVAAAGSIALTVGTAVAGAALLATPIGWGLIGAAAVAGVGLSIYSAYKTIKREGDIGELKSQKMNVNQQIEALGKQAQELKTKTQTLKHDLSSGSPSPAEKTAKETELADVQNEHDAIVETLSELTDISKQIDLGLMESDPQTATDELIQIAQQPPDSEPPSPDPFDSVLDPEKHAADTKLYAAYQEKMEARKVIEDVFGLPPDTYKKKPTAPNVPPPASPGLYNSVDAKIIKAYQAEMTSINEGQSRLLNKLSMFYTYTT